MESVQVDMELVDGLVTEMIGEAVLAHAYREAIRRAPTAAAGFNKLAAKHSDRAATLAGEIGRAAALAGPAAAQEEFPHPPTP